MGSTVNETLKFTMTTDSLTSLTNNVTKWTKNVTGPTDINASVLRRICRLQLCNGAQTHFAALCAESFKDILDEIDQDAILSHQVPNASRVILTILFSFIIIISVIGNLLVIITFVVNKHMRSVTNIFILSLAISDLLVILTCTPVYIATTITTFWTIGSFACKLLPFITVFVVSCSSLTLCCIAFDRYYAIIHPLKLKFLQTPVRATILQSIVWVISAATSIPYSFFFEIVDMAACKINDEESKLFCMAHGHDEIMAAYETVVIPIVLLLGPFLFMSVMYAVICHKLWIQRPIGARTQQTYDGRLRLKKKAIKMLITVVILFVLCWSPILSFNAIANKYNVQVTTETVSLRAYLQCLGLSSCCWNPIVYAFMNENFRKAFATLFVCKKKRVHPVLKGNTCRMSTESRKTTTNLEMAGFVAESRQTSETNA